MKPPATLVVRSAGRRRKPSASCTRSRAAGGGRCRVAVGLLVVGLAGCGGRPHETAPEAARPAAVPGAAGGAASALEPSQGGRHGMTETMRRQLLAGAVGVLARLDDFEESAAFAQVFDRLGQWRHASEGLAAGPGGAAKGLDEALWREVPGALRTVAAGVVEPAGFDAVEDVRFLRDQRWLADIAGHVVGEGVDDLTAAARLFRWTIESLAIVSDPPAVPTDAAPGSRWYLPGEILLSGRASGAQRAWVFLELLRHAGLDGVMLGTRPAPGEPARAWVPAVVVDGECHLFEPTYGLPIPGPEWQGIATARQAAEDPAILEQLDLPDRPYPVRSRDMRGLVVLVAASAQSHANRMRRLEADLTGASAMRITVDQEALAARALAGLPADRQENRPEGKDGSETTAASTPAAAIWSFPLETVHRRREAAGSVAAVLSEELAPFSIALVTQDGQSAAGGARRPLYAARVREFRNQLDGPDGAKAAYLMARPSKAQIREITALVDPAQAEAVGRTCQRMKDNATYWLGLVMAREQEFEAAVDYLDRMTLAGSANSIWADAARVAAARAYERLGQPERARNLLLGDESPQRYGSRLLAEKIATTPENPP